VPLTGVVGCAGRMRLTERRGMIQKIPSLKSTFSLLECRAAAAIRIRQVAPIHENVPHKELVALTANNTRITHTQSYVLERNAAASKFLH
jgi:hypothetical protein